MERTEEIERLAYFLWQNAGATSRHGREGLAVCAACRRDRVR